MKTWIVATVLLALGGAGLFWYEHRHGGAAQSGGQFQMPPPSVEVTPVVLGTVERTVEAVGTLRANESVTIRPEIAGRVVAIGFKEGEKVRKGATLITLDDSVNRRRSRRKSRESQDLRTRVRAREAARREEGRLHRSARSGRGATRSRRRGAATRPRAARQNTHRGAVRRRHRIAHRQRRRFRRRRSGARQPGRSRVC